MIEVISGFAIFKDEPVDSRIVKQDITTRNAIPEPFRYEGLSVYVIDEQRAYRLVGGVTDSDWAEIEGVDAYTKAETDTEILNAFASHNWKQSVATLIDLATTYPDPSLGWVSITEDDGGIYYYNGATWESAGVSAAQLANKIDKISGGVTGDIVMISASGGLETTVTAFTDLLIISQHRGLSNGVASLDSNGLIPVAQIPGGAIPYRVVPDITARNALSFEERDNRVIHVVDASGDSTVESGSAGYWWDETASDPEYEWVKTYEGESTDVTLEWDNILNGPSETPTAIDNAAAKAHTQGTDQFLDEGGVNEVSVGDIRSHIDDDTSNPHGVTKADVGLENVEDKSSAEIRAEIQETDIPGEIDRVSLRETAIQDLKGNPSTGYETLEEIEARIGEASGGGETALEIDATVQVGGVDSGANYPAGTPLETIITDILAPYVIPSLDSLSVRATPDDSVYEVGQSVLIEDATLAWTNDSEEAPPQNMYLDGPGFYRAVTELFEDADAATNVQKTTDEEQQWILTGEDNDSNSLTQKSFSKFWRFMHCFGATSTILTAGSTPGEVKIVLDLLHTRELRAGKSADVVCTSQNNDSSWYTYIAYPSKYGDLSSIIQDGSLPVLGAFTKLGEFSYQNDFAHNENYFIYISNSDAAFASGVTLDID